MRRRLLPGGALERIFDRFQHLAVRVVWPRTEEGPQQDHAALFHHPTRGDVDRIRRCDDALHAWVGKSPANQRARSLRAVALTPRRLAQSIAKLRFGQVDIHAWLRSEVKPAQKIAAVLLDGGPEAVARVPLVVLDIPGQVLPQLGARRRTPAVDPTHDLWVAVQFDQVVEVGLGELA